MNGNFETEDMPPELEDFSDELNKIRSTRGNNNPNESTEIKVDVVESAPAKKQEKKPEEDNFGAFMKKGFFKRNQTENTTEKKNISDLTYIKSNPDNSTDKKILKEFENELKINSQNMSKENKTNLLNNIVEKKDEWMSQELLMKIAQRPNLMKCFMDPKFSQVVELLQKDPQKAMAQFGHVKEFNEFIKEFSAIMAEHFGNLSKQKESAQTSQNSNNFDQETQLILNDAKIMPILTKLQTEGKLDIEEINKDPYISSRVNKLIEKGVFRVQRESELNK